MFNKHGFAKKHINLGNFNFLRKIKTVSKHDSSDTESKSKIILI